MIFISFYVIIKIGECMDTYDETEKFVKIFKYGKYVIIVLVIIITFLIIRACTFSYSKVESALVEEAKKYIEDKKITILEETFIEAYNLDVVEGTELCSKSSGVIISNENGKLKYKAYLDCPDYKSNVIKNPEKYIKLNGDNVVALNINELYEEPGHDNLVGADIEEIKGNTNSNIYTITYKAYIEDELKEIAYRKVIIVSKDKKETLTNLKNTEEPVISLNGDKSMTIPLKSKYIEPGYTAYDYKDKKISRNVKISGKVDTNVVGQYKIDYMVTNSQGKTATAERYVNVVREMANLTINLSYDTTISNRKTINGKVSGSGFAYVVFPNGEKKEDANFTYTVEFNGTNTFSIYDVYGNRYVKEIEVSGVDRNLPTGSCEADYRTKSVTVTVNASDDSGIKNYEYIINSSKEESESNKFVKAGEYNKNNASQVSVNVYDIAGNVSKLTCTTILNLVPNMYRDSLGYDCLEPYTCYKQKDYSDPYQATINGVGTIYRSGCLPTSLTIISTKYNRRSKSGELYTPPTLIKEIIYPDGKIRGYSNYARIQEVAAALNLKISTEYKFRSNTDILVEHLKKGDPALVLLTKGCLAAGSHFMVILGINDNNQVFLSDPNSRSNKSVVGTCPVNTWVDLELLKSGTASVEYFVLFNE